MKSWDWFSEHRNDVIPEDELVNSQFFTRAGLTVDDRTYEDVRKSLHDAYVAYYDTLYDKGIIAPEVFSKTINYRSSCSFKDIIDGNEVIDGHLIHALYKRGYGAKFAADCKTPYLVNTMFSRMIGDLGGAGYTMVGGFDVSFYKRALEQYCPIGGVVYDPSCGWGNRLVACTEYDIVKYLGTDPSVEMKPYYDEYVRNHVYRFQPDIRCHGSEVYVPEWEGIVDLVCTCPPYYNVEKYPGVEGWGSVEEFKNFVYNTVENCYRYLLSNGVCLFYVGDNILIKLSELYADAMNCVGFKDIGWYVKDKGNVGNNSKVKSKSAGWVFGRK